MTKKIVIFALTLVMLLSCTACGGDSFKDSLFFNVDFSTESLEDSVGKVARSTSETLPTYEDDSEVGRKVAKFANNGINYLVDTTKMADAFTIETYVNVEKTKEFKSFALICGTYFYNTKKGVGIGKGYFDLGEGDPLGSQQKILTLMRGVNGKSDSIEGGEYDKWQHIVFVHDGEKDYYYVDGKDITNGGVASAGKTMQHDSSLGFRIGAYNQLGQFAVDSMKMAYTRIYSTAATADQVKTLFDARNAK